MITMPETVSKVKQVWRELVGPSGPCCLLPCFPACHPVLYLLYITHLLQDLFYMSPLPGSLSGFFSLLALGECLSACEVRIHLQICSAAWAPPRKNVFYYKLYAWHGAQYTGGT